MTAALPFNFAQGQVYDQVGDQSQLIEALQDGLTENLKDLERVVTSLQGALPLLCKNTLHLFQIVAQCEESRHRERQLFLSQIQMLQLQAQKSQHESATLRSQHASIMRETVPKTQLPNVAKPLMTSQKRVTIVSNSKTVIDNDEDHFECFEDFQQEDEGKDKLLNLEKSQSREDSSSQKMAVDQSSSKQISHHDRTQVAVSSSKGGFIESSKKTAKPQSGSNAGGGSSWMIKKSRVPPQSSSNTARAKPKTEKDANMPATARTLRSDKSNKSAHNSPSQQTKNELAPNQTIEGKAEHIGKNRSTDAEDVEMKTGEESPERLNTTQITSRPPVLRNQKPASAIQSNQMHQEPFLQLNADDLLSVRRPPALILPKNQQPELTTQQTTNNTENNLVSQSQQPAMTSAAATSAAAFSNQGFVHKKKVKDSYQEQDHGVQPEGSKQQMTYKRAKKATLQHQSSSSISRTQHPNQAMTQMSENTEQQEQHQNPKGGEYKFREVVRDREQRQALKGQACFRCKTFYDAVGIDDEGDDFCNKCSRHRDNEPIQNTPENFYDLDV